MPKETWSQKMRRCNAGEYQVGDLVAQDHKRDYGFFLTKHIKVETAISLLGAKAMDDLMKAPKIIQITRVTPDVMAGVQYKEGMWSIWTRKLNTHTNRMLDAGCDPADAEHKTLTEEDFKEHMEAALEDEDVDPDEYDEWASEVEKDLI